MNRSLKSILALIILITLVPAALILFCGSFLHQSVWGWANTIILILTTATLMYAELRHDVYPDLLRQRVRRYFERNGLCFAIVPSSRDGHFAWEIFFQNRYERACMAVIHFRPDNVVSDVVSEEVRLEVDCPGGAFGRAVWPYALPLPSQGKKQRFELAADAHYAAGKGKMVRFRDGVAVRTSQLRSLASFPGDVFNITRFKVQLPDNLSPDRNGEPVQEILWHPPETKA